VTPQFGDLSNSQSASLPPIGVLFSRHRAVHEQSSEVWNQRAEVDFDRPRFGVLSFQFDSNSMTASHSPARTKQEGSGASDFAHRFVAIARELLGREQISSARSVLQSVSRDQVDEPSRRLMAVLERPSLRPVQPPRRSIAAELQWLRENASQHHGRWVALVGVDLVDSDESLQALLGRIRVKPLPVSPFFHRC